MRTEFLDRPPRTEPQAADPRYTEYPYNPFTEELPKTPEARQELARQQLVQETLTQFDAAQTEAARERAREKYHALLAIKDWTYTFDKNGFQIDGFEYIDKKVASQDRPGVMLTVQVRQPLMLEKYIYEDGTRLYSRQADEPISMNDDAAPFHQKFSAYIKAAREVAERANELIPGSTIRASAQRRKQHQNP